MRRIVPLLLLSLLAACGARDLWLASGACQSDDACKHGRVCDRGICRYPEEVGRDGGAPDGGVGRDGGVDGGADGGFDGGLGEARIGDACEQSAECGEGDRPVCYSEADTFGTFVGGYCSSRCGEAAPCPEGSICGMIFGADGACLRACESDAECREGYLCSSLLGPQACIPAQLLP